MKTFPMFLDLAGRRVVIVGGGEQAAQKARLMVKTAAAITVMALELEPELAGLAARGRITHHAAIADPAAFQGARLVFVCTGCAGADGAIGLLAQSMGALVNVVDRPAFCDVLTPSIVDRDPVVVAIGTEGTAPVLAREIKTRIETMLEPRLGELAALAGRLRDTVARHVPHDRRRGFWAWVFGAAPRAMHAAGHEEAAARLIKDRILAGDSAPARGLASFVGAGPGAADLITLRGVQRLQEADVIFHDRLVGPDVLELARRDAERVDVGKAPGVKAWSQDRINRLLVAAVADGRRVVRLKAGDPGVFGRLAEEIAALSAAGLDYEVVPGVTAAFAAAAQVAQPLTDRAGGRALLLAPAQGAEGAAPLNWAAAAATGANIAIYMGVATAGATAQALIAGGAPSDAAVTIIERAGAPDSRHLATTLAGLADTVARERVVNPAMILVLGAPTLAEADRGPRAARPDADAPAGHR